MAGLKTLAKELQSKGRNGDTILAHINPQEAGILKALADQEQETQIRVYPNSFIKNILALQLHLLTHLILAVV